MKYYLPLILFFCMFSTLCFSQQMSTALLDQFKKEEVVDCIIVMNDQLDLYGKTKGWTKSKKANFVFQQLQSHAAKSQRDISAYLRSKNIYHKSFFVFNGFQAKLSQEQALEILENFAVARITFDAPSQVLPTKNSASSFSRAEHEWGLLKIKADSVWQLGYRGEGVVVAGQDTGYDFDNTAILSKYRGYIDSMTIDHNYHWHDAIDTVNVLNNDTINDPSVNPCGFLSDFPCDDHGHGSHTMGTMVGSDTMSEIGVAPAATWIGCRNMDRGWGKPSTYTECFEWFLAPTDLEGQYPDPDKAPHVINNSWGCPPQEGCHPENWSFMETVVNNLTAAGTVVVVSAGNDGGDGCSSIRNPAAIFENSFSVGATREDDSKPGFSSIGPVMVDSSGRLKPDVVAPGFNVRSIWLNDTFASLRGTSMAGPHVAGAVALIINANPALSGQVDIIKDILKSTAVPLIDSTECLGNTALSSPNFYYGHGRIDVFAAVQKALSFATVTEEVHISEISAYPNPNTGDFIIASRTDESLGEVFLRTISGELIERHPAIAGRSQIQIQNLEPGMYIYSVVNLGHIQSGKIVVTQH